MDTGLAGDAEGPREGKEDMEINCKANNSGQMEVDRPEGWLYPNWILYVSFPSEGS